MKGIYDYVLDFMITLDKMKNNSTSICTVIVFFISFNLICNIPYSVKVGFILAYEAIFDPGAPFEQTW